MFVVTAGFAFEKAVKSHSKALEIAPSDYSALIGRANAYKSMRNFEKAFEDTKKSLEIYSSESENIFLAHSNLGYLKTKINDFRL